MTRPTLVDAFIFHDELDILEMRLTELYDAIDQFVLVEASVTHNHANPKPSYYSDNRERFAPFADKIIHVWVDDLPTFADDPDPWCRELGQREGVGLGLAQLNLADTDIVLFSDVDEFPQALHARNIRPNGGFLVFGQRGHYWAVDWQHPHIWRGTVAATVSALGKLPADLRFQRMRDMRGFAPCPAHLMDSGWHFSWLGGPDRTRKKVDSFCHLEVEDTIKGAIDNDDLYRRLGYHCDGFKMNPVDVNDEWPKWIRDGNAPESWYRPRVTA